MMERQELQKLADFIKHFEIHWNLFVRRYIRFKELENSVTYGEFDYCTYFDMLIVHIRAMCIESPNLKSNYTIQNMLRRIDKPELAQKIDDELEKPLIEALIDKDTENPLTLRKAIKILSDGFICHYDNFDGEKDIQRGIAIAIEGNLKNKFNSRNIYSLVNTMVECVEDGFFGKEITD